MKGFFSKVIILVFITAMAACRSNKQSSTFEWLAADDTGIQFRNQLPNKERFNILYYLYYYNGGGVSVGDINNDGLEDVYFTANTKGANKLFLNQGNFKFKDITNTAGVAGVSDWSSGTNMVDINGDGLLDITVCAVSGKFSLNGHNQLFINNGNNTFTDKSKEYGVDFSGLSVQTAFLDFDRDGDLDFYLLNQSYHPHSNVTDTSKRQTVDSLAGDRFYRNDLNTTGKFTNVSKEVGIYQSKLGYGLGISVADLNNDGWQDIYVGNDFHENDYYYINNQQGGFVESGAKHFGHYSRFSMGNDVNDFDNDAQPDVITVDMLPPDEATLKTYGSDENPDVYHMKLTGNGYQHQVSRNCLQKNLQQGTSFSDVALMKHISSTDWSWSPLFADFDNDGWKDLLVTSGIVKRPVDLDYIRFVSSQTQNKGLNYTDAYDQETIAAMPDGSSHIFLFKNRPDSSFLDITGPSGLTNEKGYFNGAAYADLDNDGDLDIVVNRLNGEASVLRNNTTNHSFLQLSLQGNEANTQALGAKVMVYYDSLVQYSFVSTTRGFQSGVSSRLHFGIPNGKIDSVEVVWPNGRFQVLKQVPANKKMLLRQTEASGNYYTERIGGKPEPTWLLDEKSIPFRHQENAFTDYNVQYLIPHAQSTRGPKIAVGDVNNDGKQDFFIGGAKGQPGALFVQQPNGQFAEKNQSVFAADKMNEDVDALFFDIDNNGWQDLYVVSGGNEPRKNAEVLEDRIYLNDGSGNLLKVNGRITQQYENKTCVAAADFNKDGYVDLFVGNGPSATGYGLPQTSFLYRNNQKGALDITGADVCPLTKIGMVGAAKFADVNNDTWPDLIVTGEWMPIKIFINQKGKFVEQEIPKSTGLWQTLAVMDINQDGNLDILAGNWGTNSKLAENKTGPLKLYVKDFDNNGTNEQVLCYTIGNTEYPFLGKDELEKALPVLKKAYLTYKEVAGKDVKFIFYDLFKDYVELKAEVLHSSYLLGDGKGGFTMHQLPNDLQMAPIMSFAQISGSKTILAGGNFFDVIPYEGRYDALPLTVFAYDAKNKKCNVLQQWAGINGQVRDIQTIQQRGITNVLVARNNNTPILCKPK